MTADVNVSTVVNANNAFISFLDHLPCDIVRSLWVTQSLSLKNEEIRSQLDSLLRDQRPGKITKVETLRDIANLRGLLLRNSRELVAEAEQLSQILAHHQRLSSNELHLMDILKDSRNQQNTRTWEEFTRFKRKFVATVQDDSDADDEDPLAQKREIVLSAGDSRVKKKIKEKKETREKVEKHENHTRISIKLGTESPVAPTPSPAPKTPPQEQYCVCRGPSMGKMIACDNSSCPIEWFHYKCVGLYADPGDKRWFCSPECEQKYKNRIARKRRRRKAY
ncbi:hypothetical protein KL930_002846 [Ogataea haglerorum]|uniref:Zinc finger PHD-type domain-containing protein n=1 Tax=Ogataea haglerorum TaxID=1937702 RepID=A0ABQ7RGY9_9ASCO|nr:uncharacterized protein KL911_002897 [Ogataea haglerorum]KAG7691934.1 hypothetical protein KL915_004997 [Ogataea haglerorum]KAG7702852.1 hypothetical protein KL950_004930 [Ogataea haglerorum]KAG7719001.1 hypothetical protein KL913_001999 [Ogataea haglerorum]KAG7720174.1 hypothetical protein KL949_002139 [Ogataea haglerorum]KAG7734223.1 hypothetical protein KL932_004898 [Ogataea haglerorum]